MARAHLLVVLALCLCVGCSGDDQSGAPAEERQATATEAATSEDSEPNQDPGDFLKEIINQRFLGQHGRVWETLHPLHQAVASRAEYSDCEGREPSEGGIEKLEVVDTYDEPLRIPGQTADVPSRAVTLRITVKVPALDDPQAITQTSHAVAEGDQWRWILATEDYEAYEAGRCPPEE